VPPRSIRAVTGLVASAAAVAALVIAARVLAGGAALDAAFPELVAPAGGLAFHVDRLGAIFLALVAVVALFAAIYGVSYTGSYGGRRSLGFFGLMFNGFIVAMLAVPCAGNVFTFLLSWELMAITSYFLVMTESEDAEVRRAGLWYAVMTHAGFVLLLPMFFLMAPSADATTFADLRGGAAALPPATRSLVFVLALVAFGSKAGVVPLHVWLPRAHPVAPSHVSALMSGVMIKLGIYGLLRVTFDLLGGGPAWWGGVLLAAGSISALFGVLYALMEHDLKRLLAYHSVENIGIILIGLGAGAILQSYGLRTLAALGFAGALFHTVNHACFKSLLFFGAGGVVHETRTRNMEEMGGLIKRMPQTAIYFLVGAAAIAALPPLNGFASEWLVFQSLLAGTHVARPEVAVGFPIAVGVLALTSGLAAACFVKAFGITFLAMPRSDRAAGAHEVHWSMRLVMLVFAAACVVLGLASPVFVRGLDGILESIPALATSGRPTSPPLLWLAVPNGVARMSPVLLGALVVAVIAAMAAAIRIRGLVVRRADTWGCGRIGQTSRMEYTASAFAEPLRRIFSELYRPTEDLSITAHPDSPYFVRTITYTSHVAPWIETTLYDPIAAAVRSIGASVGRLQAGSVHLYLLYVSAALAIALATAWWFK
jgi:hydrogenase-4 component B